MTNSKKIVPILVHAIVGWALCGATMGIGMTLLQVQTALIVHAIGAPIFFILVSWNYFRKFNYTTPLQTAFIFTIFVIAVDFFGVALLVYRSLEMFNGLLGTWIPFTLIFAATYITGSYIVKSPGQQAATS